MNLRSTIFCVAVGAGLLGVAARALTPSVAEGAPDAKAPGAPAYPAHSSSPRPRALSSSSPSASGSAAIADLPDHRFDLPPLDKEVIPTDRSELPTADEWKNAPLVEVTRRSPMARWCRVYRVREYLKVHCGMPMAGLRQLAGSPKDVQIFVVPKKADQALTDPPNGGQAIFPLRRDDARLFQFFDLSSDGWEGWSPGASVVIDASWPTGTDAPTVVLR